MKNLRRILVAVAILLLVACSVGIVAAAADQYTGTVAGLQNEYKKVERDSTASGKSTKLAAVYDYLKTTPVDPASEGYDEIIAQIDGATITIANSLINEINNSTSLTTKKTAYDTLMVHLEACVPTVVTDEWNQLVAAKPTYNATYVASWLDSIKATADTQTARSEMIELYKHLEADPLPAAQNRELLTNCSKAAYDVAQALYEEIVSFDETVEYGQTKKLNKINHLKSFIEQVNITSGDVETPNMKTRVNELVKWGKEMLEAKRIELDKQANFDSYDYTTYHTVKDFDGNLTIEEYNALTPAEQKAYNDRNSLWTVYNSTDSHYTELGKEKDGNGYQALVYGGPSASHLYIEPQFEDKGMSTGLVIEMDMWLSDDFYSFSFDSREPSNAGSKIQALFKIAGASTRSGPITISAVKNQTGVPLESYGSISGVIERESWFHLTFTFDPVSRIGKVYVNYEYMFDIAYNAVWKTNGLRMSVSTTDMEVRMDNFEFYQGTQPRIFDKFLVMDYDDQFEYYVDYMNDTNNSSLFRNIAYKKAENLLTTYKEDYLNNAPAGSADHERYQGYINMFNACDYVKEIKEPAMAENIELLKGYVNELLAIDITSETFEDINKAIAKIEEFVKVNSELIDRGDTTEGGYQTQMAYVQEVKKGMIKIENAIAFVDAMKQFARATTSASMLKRYEAVKAIYELAKYTDPANIAAVATDPYIVAFEETINKDCEPGEEMTIFEYYDSIEQIILVREMYENSKKVLECYNFITSLEGYESTKEFWSANYEFIASYTNVIRDIVNPGLYDASIEGVDAAVAEFRQLDVYFYERLQKEHIAYIQAQLDKYRATNTYIDKAGITTGLISYVNQNGTNNLAIYLEIDENGESKFIVNPYLTKEVAKTVADEIEELRQLEIAIYVCNEELAIQIEEYEDVLASNTAKFVSIIKHMQSVVDYKELKPLFEEATAYYYAINLENDEIVKAAEIYDEYRLMIGALESNGIVFIGLVNELVEAEKLTGLEREDAVYTAIAKCAIYADGVDTTMEGVDVAMKAYTRALNEYNAETRAANAVIENSDTITFAANTKSIAAAVLSVLVGIVKD